MEEFKKIEDACKEKIDPEFTPAEATEHSDVIANAIQAIRDDMAKDKDEPTIDE